MGLGYVYGVGHFGAGICVVAEMDKASRQATNEWISARLATGDWPYDTPANVRILWALGWGIARQRLTRRSIFDLWRE